MRYELETLEKIMFYDTQGIMTSFPLYVYKTKDKVNKEVLEQALDNAIKCHPLFGCRLSEDEKGPYLETNPDKPVVPYLDPEEEFYYGNKANNNYLWIVGIHEDEIIYTGYHGFTDGMGATAFMRSVLYYYFSLQGIKCDPGKAVTLEKITPEYLEKETECSVRNNGAEDHPSLIKQSQLQPSIFPDELLKEDPQDYEITNLAISLADIKKKCAEYDVSQFAVMTSYLAQAVASVLPGSDDVVLMNIIADMRGVLDSITTHNCVMSVPITFAEKDMMNKSDQMIATMFRTKLDIGYNRDEALHNCFNNAQMEKQIGGNREYLSAAAAQITKQFAFNLPIASLTYTHLTHTGFSSDILEELDDVYISYAGYKKDGKQGIRALNAVTADKVINLMIIDGTKDEKIVKALERRLEEVGVSYKTTKLDRYKGILYRR